MHIFNFLQKFGVPSPLPERNIIITLIASLAFTLLFSYVRIYFLRDKEMGKKGRRIEFISTMSILSPAISLIMILVGSDLANAFALLGIMSIIKLQNPAKGAGDIMYYLVAIVIGMTCGEQYFLVAGIFCIFSSTVLICIKGISKFTVENDSDPLETQVGNDHAENNKKEDGTE